MSPATKHDTKTVPKILPARPEKPPPAVAGMTPFTTGSTDTARIEANTRRVCS
jgi:hypothetical protein